MALFAALCVGCGRGNAPAATAGEKDGHVHDHGGHVHAAGESCVGDHDTRDHDSHAAHSHDAGEACDGGHAGHDHDSHAGHGHSAKDRKNKKPAKHNPHSGHDHDAHAGHDHGSGAAADPDEIVFPADQAARTDFEVRPALRGTFRETIKCGGQVTAAQDGVISVAAPVSGVITPYDGRMAANSLVGKGQHLFRIYSGGLASGDAIAKARINYTQAKANYERVQTLFTDRLVTRREYLEAEAAYLTAKAEFDPVRDSDGEGGALITSPIGGYVTRMHVSAGDFVEMGQPLATISRTGRMQLRAMVSQRYFNRLPGIADANFRTPASDEYYNVRNMGGKIYSTGRMVSQGSSLIPVVFEFSDDGTIPDGAHADVTLLGAERDGVMTLPLTAITEQQGLHYVYVQLDAEHYSRREVALGPDDGVRVEILSGVREGDMVVTRGAVNVKMASASGAIPHGHTH